MSKSRPALLDEPPIPADLLACCTPLAHEPMTTDQAAQVAPLLKAIADPVRLRLLSIVLSHQGQEACVCDLTPRFDLSQPTISHHLKVLHESGLLDREKRGTWVFYKARPEAMAALVTLFTATAADAPSGQAAELVEAKA
jgi:ArsR family transcriptional regulator